MNTSILVVDDDKVTRETLARSLANAYDTVTAGSGAEALHRIAENDIDVALVDLCMPDMNGLALQEQINRMQNPPLIIFITGHGNVEAAVQAMKQGACDFITKPVNLDRLELLIEKSLETRRLREENLLLKNRLREQYAPAKPVGDSPMMQRLVAQLLQVAPTQATVLIEGESGTGKELLANIVHYHSDRAAGPFIKVNCGGFVENLLESELFGHEKGAFTGAVASRKGRCEMADKGTLFLDEVGDLPLSAQVKLLRFLQEKTFERVGGNKTLKVDVRIIAATNNDLEELLKTGRFREDLFFRLCVFRVKVPPLRLRPEDIDPLIGHFLNHFGETHHRPLAGIDQEILAHMRSYPWPGNVRELMNCIESMVVSATGPWITKEALPDHLLFKCRMQEQNAALEGALAKNERRLIAEALQQTGGNKVAAAKILGIGLRTLYRRLEEEQGK